MRIAPRIEISIEGIPNEADILSHLVECRIERSLQFFDVCTLVFHDPLARLRDSDLTVLGRRIVVKLSEAGQTPLVFEGETIAAELEMLTNTPPILTLRAFDYRNQLHQNVRTRVFVDVTITDVVREIAKAYLWEVEAEEFSEVHPWILQHQQTDWELLQNLAATHFCSVQVQENRVLSFLAAAPEETEPYHLDFGHNLVSFRRELGRQEAEGHLLGIVPLTPRSHVLINRVGERFGGLMTVHSTTHHYESAEGFRTDFTVSNTKGDALLGLLDPSGDRHLSRPKGAVEAIVVDVGDPERLGRVRLCYPSISETFCSDWALVALAPNQPPLQVDSRVLVRFMDGDIHQPIVANRL